MKKNAFASAILFGENNNSSISGFLSLYYILLRVDAINL